MRTRVALLACLLIALVASREARATSCDEDLLLCDPGETTASCPSDCGGCGDLRCDPGESAASCPEDCGPCGNLLCEPGEETSCAADCDLQVCGDLLCGANESGCGIDCGLAACANGEDDDGDGLADAADPGCASGTDLDERDPSLPCDDGADNDADTRADFPLDPGCFDGRSPTESPQCQNGRNDDGQYGTDFDGGASLDLDGNGFVDVQFDPATGPVGEPDPQCVGRPARSRESPSCGLGAELALLGVVLAPLHRRRRTQGCYGRTE